MKKQFVMAAAIAAVLGAGILTMVACNKDNEKADGDQQSQTAKPTKSYVLTGDAEADYNTLLHYYWAACDSAYQANSSAFLNVCRSGDLAAMHSMTGLTSEIETQIDSLGRLLCQQYFAAHPEELNQPAEPCQDCQNASLTQLGTWIQDIHNLRNDIYAISPEACQDLGFPLTDPHPTDCERDCLSWIMTSIAQGLNPNGEWCFLFCNFKDYFIYGTGVYLDISTE